MMDKKAKYLPIWGRYVELFLEENLTDAEVGKLFRWMLDYLFNGREPEKMPGKLRGYWFFLKMDLDNAQLSYETKVENGRKGGKRSAQLRLEQESRDQEDLEEGSSSTDQAASSTHQANSSSPKQNQQRTRTESRSESITESRTNTNTGSAPASEEAGICKEKKAYGEFGWVKLTAAEYRRLEKLMGFAVLRRCIDYIDLSAQTNGNKNRWKDWALLVRRCYEGKWYEKRYGTPEPVPKGASGYLGQAELEAIQQIMSRDIPDVILPGEEEIS